MVSVVPILKLEKYEISALLSRIRLRIMHSNWLTSCALANRSYSTNSEFFDSRSYGHT